jgi:tetratricopeptide (TPR) repeat protein
MEFADGAEGTRQVKILSYLEKGDTASWANYLREETIKEPAKNNDYVQMLLAYYQKHGKEKMVEYADAILAVDPNLYIANYGKAYALFANNKYEEALALYKKCTEIKSDSYDSWYQCGLCRYREALDLNNTISSIKNQQKAKETLEKTKKLFGEAIPFFEKARECTPDEPEKWAYELKQCYTVTGNAAKASEMAKLIGE